MKKGDWVITKDNPFFLGRVRAVYAGSSIDPATLIDVVIYNPENGKVIGRDSPPEGGPTGFEPACAAEFWEVIPVPTFPLLRCNAVGPDYGSYRPYVRTLSIRASQERE
jgi:hypothetical protein